jgi:hypothetical protein
MDFALTLARRNLTLLLMSAAFVIALALAAIFLVNFGVGERGTATALQATARWSFLLFWSAYVGSAIARLWPRFNVLACHGRDLGLSYASAQLIHLGLVFWIIHVATRPSGAMMFFWIGIFCTYLLALLSLSRLRDALDPRLWRALRMIAMEYIAIAFTSDFIDLHLDALGKLRYLPFALMLVVGAGLRIAAFWDRRLRPPREDLPLRMPDGPALSQFGGMSREDYFVVWPALLFIAAIVILLAVDVAALGGYVLFKSATRGARLIGRQFK